MVSSSAVKDTSVSGSSRLVAPTQRGVYPQRQQVKKPAHPPTAPLPRSLVLNQTSPGTYPWRKDITATVFWIGETPTANNPTPNHKSSWDTTWQENFGGFDNPETSKRCPVRYCPKDFIPRQNPFYIALPYNDCVNSRQHKPEAARVIPWFHRDFVKSGQSVCKGKWVQIFYKGKYCFAQWEDCGPFTTDDWAYVFGNSPPKNKSNKAAGIDISPAVRDYLGLRSGEKVHWRFVDFPRIPPGPWSKFGDNNPFVKRQPTPQELRQSNRIKQYEKLRAQVQKEAVARN